MGRSGLCYGPFWLGWAVLYNATGRLDNFLGIKIFGAVLVGAVLAMGRFGIVPTISLYYVMYCYMMVRRSTVLMWRLKG